MLYREELNKLLQLLDAGIIGFDDNNFDGPVKRVYGAESFEFDFASTNMNPTNIHQNLDKDLTAIIAIIDKANSLQNLKIGKNTIKYVWKINFFNVVVNIEDAIIDSDNLNKSSNTKTYFSSIEDINTYLLDEFGKLISFIKDPSISNQLQSSIDFQKFETLIWYFENYGLDYDDLISGKIKIDFKYVIDIFSEKV